jgi:hypothetical protein
MDAIATRSHQSDSEELRRADLLLAAGWVPQNSQEGAVRRTHGYIRTTQISTSIWRAMQQILSVRPRGTV